ncbi:MAG: restriction endonuclease subunit S [Methylobacter sp.]|nr:restriction endonuclease subunit S [Methylobacter sp.]
MSENLPKGWMQTSIGKLTEFNSLFSDGDWVESKDQDVKGKNRLIQLADIGDGVFIDKSARFMNDEQFSRLNCTNLKKGDILIARMPEPLGRACLFPLDNGNFATVVDVAILRTPNADHYWLMTIINSQAFRKQIELNAVGTTRTRIPRKELSKIKLIAPPLTQQQKIARILSTVDTVIEKTEAAIAKYKAIKSGMMHDLFTRGIADNGQLRPAYEDAPKCYKQTALGWIPKEWNIFKICEVSTDCLKNGYFKKPELVGKGYKLINVSELYQPFGIDIFNAKVERVFVPDNEYKKYGVSIGDIFFTRSSLTLDGIAQCNIILEVKERVVFECHVMRLRPQQNIVLPIFLALYCRSNYARLFFMGIAKQVTMTTISQSDIEKLDVVLPDLNEQRLITQKIESIDKKIQIEQNTLNKYQKLKQGLMQDLLTGKVTVSV